MTSIRVALESVSKAFVRPKWTPPLDLKYTLRDIDPAVVTPSGWIPPQGLQEVLPFHVFRTTRSKNLPVYTDIRNGRTRCLTILRRYRGDEKELAEEMSRVCDGKTVTIRPGRLEVTGNYRGRVKEWLYRLGF